MQGKQYRIVITDDSPSNLSILFHTLNNVGFEVFAAQNAMETLEIAETITPDIFLIDVMMPGINGISLCRQIKQNKRFQDVPIMFITARSSTTDIIQGLKAGAIDYITKPFHRFEVLARIRTHIKLHDAMKEIQRLRQLALDANPLTELPGNNTIASTIQEKIDQHLPVSVIYCDLDNFKAYNDCYGFTAGDQVLLFTAKIIRGIVHQKSPDEGFIGHIGGDDYVIIVPSEQAMEISQSIITLFDEGIAEYYEPQDRMRGYIIVSNRQRQFRKYPFVALSMAGVELARHPFVNVHEVSTMCSEMKKKTKAIPGSVYFTDRRSPQ